MGNIGGIGLAVSFAEITAETGLTPDQIAVAAGGATFEEIGIAIGVSTQRAQQICYRALDKLYAKCKQAGLSAADVLGRNVGNMARAEDSWLAE